MIPRYYTTIEIAEILRVKPQTIRVWRMKGIIKASAHTPTGFSLYLLEDVKKQGEERRRRKMRRYRETLSDCGFNPSLDEALNSGAGVYKP